MNLFTTAVWHSNVDPQEFFPRSNVCIVGLTCSTLSFSQPWIKTDAFVGCNELRCPC